MADDKRKHNGDKDNDNPAEGERQRLPGMPESDEGDQNHPPQLHTPGKAEGTREDVDESLERQEKNEKKRK